MDEYSNTDVPQTLEHRVQELEHGFRSLKTSFDSALLRTHVQRIPVQEPLNERKAIYSHSQREWSPALNILRRHVEDFWNNISLPGLKYVGEPGRHRSDRYIWILILFLSLLVSSWYIQDAYKKWKRSPVLLTFNDRLTPISLIPFPAVTICPARRLQDEDTLQDILVQCNQDNCTKYQKSILSSARLLCPESNDLNEYGTEFYEGSLLEPIQEVSVNCEEFFEWFRFGATANYYTGMGNHSVCSKFFQKIYRDGGRVCFTFNMLPAVNIFNKDVVYPIIDETTFEKKKLWSSDMMLETADLDVSTIPRHTSSNGQWAGFFFYVMNPNVDQSELCNNRHTSTKIIVHHPAELPTEYAGSGSLTLTPNKAVQAQVMPALVTASNELVDGYTPESRRCFFAHERKLSLFRMYTQRNCVTECRVNCSLELCDCVSFFLPRKNSSVKVCGREDKNSCSGYLVTAYLEGQLSWADILWFKPFTSKRFQRQFEGYEAVGFENGTKLTDEILEATSPCRCDCPAACNTLDYDLRAEEQENIYTYFGSENYTKVSINFKDLEVTSVIRKELIGLTDFIANSGGVLGVFTGFSFLALCELVYFVTIRLWTTIKHAWDDESDTVVGRREKLKCCFCCGPVVVD